MKVSILLLTFLLSYKVGNAKGQFPSVCNTQENLDNKICCPNNCNADRGRGNCTNIEELARRQWGLANRRITTALTSTIPNLFGKQDSRVTWPSAVFSQVCVCNDPYFGTDCGECVFGRMGEECNEEKTIIRRRFTSLSNEEKLRFRDVLIQSRGESEKQWAVITDEPDVGSSDSVTLQNVSTYNLFVYLHSFSARENNAACSSTLSMLIDFAHEGPNFPTWHRYFMLIVERELQKISRDPNFSLPYWDWGEEDGTSILTDEYLGRFDFEGEVPSDECIANLVIDSRNWLTVCDTIIRIPEADCATLRAACNVERDLLNNSTLCRQGRANTTSERSLPAPFEIVEALKEDIFNSPDPDGNWTIKSTDFRNKLEGYVGMNCTSDGSSINTTSDPVGNLNGAHNFLHNQIHLFIGGHLAAVPASSNDPIFFLHHVNVDRLLEIWLRLYYLNASQNTYQPISGAHPGHNRDDWLVPFLPLATNSDMYNRSSAFGYEYDSLQIPQPRTCGRRQEATTPRKIPLIVPILLLIAVIFFIIYCR